MVTITVNWVARAANEDVELRPLMMNQKFFSTPVSRRMLFQTRPLSIRPLIRHMHLTSLAFALSAGVVLSACTSLPVEPEKAKESTSEGATTQTAGKQSAAATAINKAIVANVLDISRQVLPPLSTTLQFGESGDDPLLEHIIEQMADAGYGIQRVSADQGSHFFSYETSESRDDNGDTIIAFDATIGALRIGRDYLPLDASTISPASPFRLSGTRAQVTVADQATESFKPTGSSDTGSVVYVASLNLDEQAPPVISLLTGDLIGRVVDSNTQGNSVQALNSSRLEVNNLFYADQSNFTNILDGYEKVDRQVIVFGNDSLILGSTNKRLLENLVSQRVKPDDLIGLIGCSNGLTTLDIGNEGLALGRAKRVTQALLSQGIARERILDEGCWAPESAGDKFPGRGVVLELWRKV